MVFLRDMGTESSIQAVLCKAFACVEYSFKSTTAEHRTHYVNLKKHQPSHNFINFKNLHSTGTQE